ncbi:conserved hypothetical protein [Coccidioides posadasii str. Silveira]|uniref:Uncharacterized protein n=1 Tax=Coccidioides posadasii (strain RMSCC 757 / Silveira) TaxID=443226 RepID=E9DJQ2_COCPS|nr:conserved hypothetical protein [Coccidioides posadasii str. Silveira]
MALQMCKLAAAQNKHSPMFIKKKSGQKLSAVKKESAMSDTLCDYCLTFVYTVHINKPCSCKQGTAKACTNCAGDKKACTSVSSEMQKEVAALLSDHDNFLRLKNVTLQEELKTSMAEQATGLSKMLAKMAPPSVQTDNSLPPPPFNTENIERTLTNIYQNLKSNYLSSAKKQKTEETICESAAKIDQFAAALPSAASTPPSPSPTPITPSPFIQLQPNLSVSGLSPTGGSGADLLKSTIKQPKWACPDNSSALTLCPVPKPETLTGEEAPEI